MTFWNGKPMLTVMLQCETPEVAIGRIRNANCLGADAYGLQVESLRPEYQTAETYRKLFVRNILHIVHRVGNASAEAKGQSPGGRFVISKYLPFSEWMVAAF